MNQLGFTLPRETMANWIIYTAENYFYLIYDRLHEELLKRDLVHADETTCLRDAFPLFVEEIERVGLNISYESRRRFKEQNYYEGSLRYENNQNIFEGEIPDRFIQDYCVAKFCESAQLILEVI